MGAIKKITRASNEPRTSPPLLIWTLHVPAESVEVFTLDGAPQAIISSWLCR
jgi:hypothetical protein